MYLLYLRTCITYWTVFLFNVNLYLPVYLLLRESTSNCHNLTAGSHPWQCWGHSQHSHSSVLVPNLPPSLRYTPTNADVPSILNIRHSRSWFTYAGELVYMWISVILRSGLSTPTPPLLIHLSPQSPQRPPQSSSFAPLLLCHVTVVAVWKLP